MDIKLRKFKVEDIPYKVKWINDSENNQYLHYDLPLEEGKTLAWFNSIKTRNDRADYTITCNDEPVGIIGLLDIDENNKKAEYYITLGATRLKGKGVATIATDLLIKKSYKEFGLKEIYLYTEVENIQAQKFFEKNSFKKIKILKNDLFYNERYIDRYLYHLDVVNYIGE